MGQALAVEQESDSAFFQIPRDAIPGIWNIIRPGILSGVERSRGRLTEENIAQSLMSGEWQLWTFWKGREYKALAITQLIVCKSGLKVLEGIICTGDDKELWEKFIPETLTEFARVEGCQIFEMWARPGWERILGPQGFKKSHVMLEKDIV